MFREPTPQQFQFETITVDELVPEDQLVRKIDAAIDFDFIRDALAHLSTGSITAGLPSTLFA